LKDLSNQKFGRLTAIKMIRKENMTRPIFWECHCECGTMVEVGNQDLIKGKTVSCGCSRRRDLTGLKFGKLTVIKIVKLEGKTGSFFECFCECGNVTITRSDSLKRGKTTSCGCNVNQSKILKFKKENPNATDIETMKERIKAHTAWNGECLEWTATTSNGYGTFIHNKKMMNASRAAWIAEYGEISKGTLVLHHCDNRRCCNVNHLFLGTHKDNTQDMVKKNRDNWDTCRKFPVGTREKVGELREQGKMYREIMIELDLTMNQVKSLLQNYKRNLKKNLT